MIGLGENQVVEEKHGSRQDYSYARQGHENPNGIDPAPGHGGDFVLRREVAEGKEDRHQNRHGEREGYSVRKSEEGKLAQHRPRKPFAHELIQPLGYGIEKEEARDEREGEEKRTNMAPNQVTDEYGHQSPVWTW